MNNALLFIIAAFIWGSTWIVITFQLGEVDPVVSIIYRYVLAAFILFAFCFLKKIPMRFSPLQHFLMAIQGIFMFGINYWAVYKSEEYIVSALAAVVSTVMVYTNVFFSFMFLRHPITSNVMVGGSIGILGILCIFLPEIQVDTNSDEFWYGVFFSVLGCSIASLGNVISSYNQKHELPVIQSNAYGMLYSSIFLTCIALALGIDFNWDNRPEYLYSMLYLAVFGSIFAFGAYITLLRNIGPGKAGYVVLVYPIVAMIFSSIFENYQWRAETFMGIGLIVFGNLIAMGKLNVVKQSILKVAKVKVNRA
ncbi:DMT family transporter [Algicola sagamiensis]|uniref:DMT family transporter n=1 Tax=Algicola sagamiensis TaxID=163869 RepID=UPI00037DC627|nr:EamA family transporter [Algicola sagamiensis]